MSGRPSRPSLRRIGVVLAVLACSGGLVACGSDAETTYADGWDNACGDVGDAVSAFRTAVSSAATDSPDAGDAQAVRGPSSAAVRADLLAPAVALRRDLAEVAGEVRALDPPERWATWHGRELQQLAVRLRSVDAGVARLRRGDPDALPLLAVGSIGPASVRAPDSLRARTPECTVLR
ncbi:hypothetical protein [Patulibacter sp.]|uniref:hypothetical protein n=1 Tax=Patulibacter sp. TaxID=1912859 RepID=UPI002715E055|nr:hypothetical protein [Patulibacter sp.]MDO9407509.1 hypothetical protein [Patulibacter sp.]